MLIFVGRPFRVLIVVIPAAVRGADPAEGRASRIASLVELAHHILIKLFGQ